MSVSKLGPGERPFTTTNVMLAFCLSAAGIPFAVPGKPLRNDYNESILRELGFHGPTDLMEAVRTCLKTGKRGRVTYFFSRAERLKRLLAVYTEQEKEIEDPATQIELPVFQMSILEKVKKGMPMDEALLRLNCVTLKLRSVFNDQWQLAPGTLTMRNEGEAEITENAKGETVVRGTGYRSANTLCSKETLGRLGF